jgi:hypothetical protein
MNDTNPAVAPESSRHLADLLRREHAALADFVVALSEFDRAGAYRPAAIVPRRTVVTEIPPPVKSTTFPVHPGELPATAAEPAPATARGPARTVVEPLTSTMSRLHLTVSRVFVAKLKRAGVPPRVKREVVMRDEGKCQRKLDSGRVCGSEVRLEIDHVVRRGKGGPSTVEKCRVLCKAHLRGTRSCARPAPSTAWTALWG